MNFTGLFCAAPISHYVYNVKCARTLCKLSFKHFLLKEEERNSCLLKFLILHLHIWVLWQTAHNHFYLASSHYMSPLYDVHCFHLDGKLGILGRFHLFGCVSVHVKQSYFTGCCKIYRDRYIWLFITISFPGVQGNNVHLYFFFLFLFFIISVHLQMHVYQFPNLIGMIWDLITWEL